MNDFAEEVGIGMLGAHFRQHRCPEPRRHGVGSVQAPAIGAAVEPMIHHPDDILGDSGLIVIQGHELAVPLEAGVVRFDSGTPRFLPGEPEPRCERRPAALGEDLCEGRKGAPDVVEDPVEQDSQPATVRGAHQGVKIGLVAEARIDPEMVDRVVPMSRRSEDGAEREAPSSTA